MSLTHVFGGRRNNFYDPYSHGAWDDPYNGQQQVHQKTYSTENSVVAPPVHGGSSHQAVSSSFAIATVEWKETPEAYIFKTEIPVGVRREDVRVEVEDDKILKISGEKFTEKEDRQYYGCHVEVSGGKFMTAFRLPEGCRVDQIRSTLEHGLLTVRIPKWEAKHHHHHQHVIPVELI